MIIKTVLPISIELDLNEKINRIELEQIDDLPPTESKAFKIAQIERGFEKFEHLDDVMERSNK